MVISVQFLRILQEYDGVAPIVMILPDNPVPSEEELIRFAQDRNVIIISPPFPKERQLVMVCATPDGITFQPRCFLSPEECAQFSPGTDLRIVRTPIGKIAMCGGEDIFQPQYARYAALEGCVLLAAAAGAMDSHLLMSGPWSIVQANHLPLALANPGGGQLILPCAMTPDRSGFGRNHFTNGELAETYKEFPVFHSLNPAFYLRYREVLES